MEGIGANSNAGTDRESTLFWIHVPRAVATEAARLIGAVALAPLLLPEHLKIEREIVIEEIRSYADDPSEQASTALDRALFGDDALGREIAGTIPEVRRLKHGPARASACGSQGSSLQSHDRTHDRKRGHGQER